MYSDLKTSILVNRQIPEFIRDEYPKFISFLEAYYEFLETQANTAVTSNNLVTTAKTLRNIKDVDDSIENFEKNFYNTYASLIPLEVQSNKALLFKHLLNLYRSKGSEGSFKLLFHLIYGQDIDVILPKNNVLRSSASKWQVDNKLRINPDVSSRYVGDGTKKVFYFPQIVSKDEITVFINGILKTNNIDYYINKEYRQLIFIAPPANGDIITVTYDNFDITLLNNRKVIGITSGASALIELSTKRIVSDTFNLGLPIELFINTKTLVGSFLNGELVSIPINDEVNNISIDIRAYTFSIVKKFNIVNKGNNYSIGDIVEAFGGNASVNAFGTVETVGLAFIDTVNVHHGGAVFSNLSPISISGNNPLTTMIAVVSGIDFSGTNAANSFLFSTDIVSNVSLNVEGPVYVNSSNFGAVFLRDNISAANVISDALNYSRIPVGPINQVTVISTTIPLSEKTFTNFDAAGALYGPTLPYRFSKSLSSVGRYKINNAGANYKVGDEVVFGPNPLGTYGQYAAAIVASVNATGAIVRVDSANTRIRGTASVNTACNELNGTSTFFTQDLQPGDTIEVNTESRVVSSITNDTLAVMTSTFATQHLDKKVGVYNRWPLGGYGYVQNNFPRITVSSAAGVGANVQIDSLIGDGEQLSGTGFSANGQINSIKLIDPGAGYEYTPFVTIIGGDGTATATAEIEQSYISTPGRWTTSDSILSSVERKLQGQDYYVDYSYVISSQVEFSKYKNLLKRLVHPVGLVNYAVYNKQNIVELTDVAVQDTIQQKTISGTVNVGNGRILVTGNNTKFNTANLNGILSIGSSIAINGEMRKISAILNQTNLITSSNVSNLTIARAGIGYSNGYLVFSGGGGRVSSLSITNAGSGYDNGFVTFSGSDEAIPAIANVEVYPATGALRSITFISGGLYSSLPLALPNNNPHRVVYANGISMTNPGQGYSNGWLVFSGGSPLRDANVRVIVHPNTVINTFVVNDSGLYQSNPTVTLNTNSNVVISTVSIATGIRRITANAGARAVNSFIIFTSNTEDVLSSANARIYVNTAGYVLNVEVRANGTYLANSNLSANIAGLRYYENNQVYDATTNSQANVVLTINTSNKGNGHSNGVLTLSGGSSTRAAVIQIETYPSNTQQVYSITANTNAHGVNGFIQFSSSDTGNTPANARIYVNSTGAIVNVVVQSNGLYTTIPRASANITPVIRVSSITANSLGRAVNSWITFYSTDGISYSPANARIFVTTSGSIANVTIYANGSYSDVPTVNIAGLRYYENNQVYDATTNSQVNVALTLTTTYNVFSNAVFTLNTVSLDGQVRKLTIIDPGLYTSAPSATLNNTPNSVVSITSNTAGNTYAGRALANGRFVFTGGIAVRDAVATYNVFPANGVINMNSILIVDAGLYRIPPSNVSPNITTVSITEVLPTIGGSGYVNGNVVFSTTQQTANIVANCVVTVNATGAIIRTRMNNVGLYANGADIIVIGILNPATATLQTPTTAASFLIGYNANTTNVANISVSTSANLGQSAIFHVTAKGNAYTNAAITIATVANSQTNAVITVGFTEQNTAANVLVEVYNNSSGLLPGNITNGAIRTLTLNTQSVLGGAGSYYYTPDITPDSAGINGIIKINPISWYSTANAQSAIIIPANSSIRVITELYNIITTEQGKDILVE